MDWKVIVMVCAIALAGILVWRMQKLKRDVCDFADGLEHSLDEILQGRKPEEAADAQDYLLGEAKEFLDKLEHQTDRLDFLFQSLVKMSRLETTGVIQIRKEEKDLFETLAGAVAAVVPAASKKGIVLEAEGGEEDVTGENHRNRLFLPHDRKWTEETVYKLLENAVKYTPIGG